MSSVGLEGNVKESIKPLIEEWSKKSVHFKIHASIFNVCIPLLSMLAWLLFGVLAFAGGAGCVDVPKLFDVTKYGSGDGAILSFFVNDCAKYLNWFLGIYFTSQVVKKISSTFLAFEFSEWLSHQTELLGRIYAESGNQAEVNEALQGALMLAVRPKERYFHYLYLLVLAVGYYLLWEAITPLFVEFVMQIYTGIEVMDFDFMKCLLNVVTSSEAFVLYRAGVAMAVGCFVANILIKQRKKRYLAGLSQGGNN